MRKAVTKSASLNFLEPSGPVQACNGTALALPFREEKNCFLWYYYLANNDNFLPSYILKKLINFCG